MANLNNPNEQEPTALQNEAAVFGALTGGKSKPAGPGQRTGSLFQHLMELLHGSVVESPAQTQALPTPAGGAPISSAMGSISANARLNPGPGFFYPSSDQAPASKPPKAGKDSEPPQPGY